MNEANAFSPEMGRALEEDRAYLIVHPDALRELRSRFGEFLPFRVRVSESAPRDRAFAILDLPAELPPVRVAPPEVERAAGLVRRWNMRYGV